MVPLAVVLVLLATGAQGAGVPPAPGQSPARASLRTSALLELPAEQPAQRSKLTESPKTALSPTKSDESEDSILVLTSQDDDGALESSWKTPQPPESGKGDAAAQAAAISSIEASSFASKKKSPPPAKRKKSSPPPKEDVACVSVKCQGRSATGACSKQETECRAETSGISCESTCQKLGNSAKEKKDFTCGSASSSSCELATAGLKSECANAADVFKCMSEKLE